MRSFEIPAPISALRAARAFSALSNTIVNEAVAPIRLTTSCRSQCNRRPRAALRTAQQPCPIGNRHARAVLCDLCSDVGLRPTIAALAPYDQPHLSRERLA